MANTVNAARVITPSPVANVDSDGNAEQRGAVIFGSIDISSYGAPETITAAALGLNVVYDAVFHCAESAEHETRSVTIAAGGKSLTLVIDDVGTGTEAGADDVGRVSFTAWGEALGSGSN